MPKTFHNLDKKDLFFEKTQYKKTKSKLLSMMVINVMHQLGYMVIGQTAVALFL